MSEYLTTGGGWMCVGCGLQTGPQAFWNDNKGPLCARCHKESAHVDETAALRAQLAEARRERDEADRRAVAHLTSLGEISGLLPDVHEQLAPGEYASVSVYQQVQVVLAALRARLARADELAEACSAYWGEMDDTGSADSAGARAALANYREAR